MKNKYPAICFKCRERVEVGKGTRTSGPKKNWIQHEECRGKAPKKKQKKN